MSTTAVCLAAGCVSQQQFDFLGAMHENERQSRETLEAQAVQRNETVAKLESENADLRRKLFAGASTVKRLQEAQVQLERQITRTRGASPPPEEQKTNEETFRKLTTAWETAEKQRRHLEQELGQKHEQVQFLQNRVERLEARLNQLRGSRAAAQSRPTTQTTSTNATSTRQSTP